VQVAQALFAVFIGGLVRLGLRNAVPQHGQRRVNLPPWPGASRDGENAATRELIDRVVARGRVMLTGCLVNGRFLARVCVLSFRTRREHMETCIAHLAEESAAILREFQTAGQ
jgi:hypothetical protein